MSRSEKIAVILQQKQNQLNAAQFEIFCATTLNELMLLNVKEANLLEKAEILKAAWEVVGFLQNVTAVKIWRNANKTKLS